MSSSLPLPNVMQKWQECVDFHRHSCPGLALGCRTAFDAMEALGLSGPVVDEEVVCVAETDSCAVDAIQIVTGCTLGKGSLLLRLRGKNAFTFFLRATGKAVRFVWEGARQEGVAREKRIHRALTAPAGELYTMKEPGFSLPETARIYRSAPCAICGEQVAEPFLRLHEGDFVCLDCYSQPLRATV